MRKQGLCDRYWYPFMYLYIYVYDQKKKILNGTLEVDSAFQTLVVDFSSNLETSSTTARSGNTFLVE